MNALAYSAGLLPPFPSPPAGTDVPEDVVTEEAGLRAAADRELRVSVSVEEGALVAEGAEVARLRSAPEVRLVAPMPSRVGRVELGPGHRLSEIVLFHEPGGDVLHHDTSDTKEAAGLRRLMQAAGVWPWIRRRPFGGMPAPDERPAAIFVMAADTRPLAPEPRTALDGREAEFVQGFEALSRLTEGPMFLCQSEGMPLLPDDAAGGRLRVVPSGPRHPQGLAGMSCHALFPAGLDTPVWDIHAEDVAALGGLIGSGYLPMRRLVRVGGPALREGRLVRTQPGADLRGLIRRVVRPGAHLVMSGSPLDGHPARWLGPRDRQVTVLPRVEPEPPSHWLIAALTRTATPMPVIPSAALHQSFGGALPSAAFVRALSAGDDESAIGLGLLSLLEEDVALPDYVLGGALRLPALLRGMLARVKAEYAA